MLINKKIAKKVLFMIFFLVFNFQVSALCDYKPNSLFTKDCSKENKGYVVKYVFDGDTISVETLQWSVSTSNSHNNNLKIRLLGIDAFELEQNQYGRIGKDFLTMLVLNKKVCVETDVQEKDIYNRTLGYVFLEKKFINEEVVKNGLAILYDFPPNIKYISRLKEAQIYGRQNRLGVWEKHSYIKETPSQWRHKHPYKWKSIKTVN